LGLAKSPPSPFLTPKGVSCLESYKAVMEAVDEALAYFGRSVREVVYYYFESRYGVNRHEIPVRLELFANCLEEIFSYASYIIERAVIEKLSFKLGVELRSKSLRELVAELSERRLLGFS